MRMWKERQGGIVLEAALVLPFFVAFMMFFVAFVRLSLYEMALQSMVSESAKVIASHMHPVDILYGQARQKWATSTPATWLDRVVTEAESARQRVVDTETFVEDFGRFIPEPIIRLVAWEKEYREQIEAGGTEATSAWTKEIRRKASEAATPLIAGFADPGILKPDKLKVTDIQLPDLNGRQSMHVTIEAEYNYDIVVPFYKRTVVLRKKATERAWIGG